ncbi:MAG: glycosyltransferase [Flavobacteriaceae bacterium]|nr:glycosyltransferase [Flavobacteriaceae bacterium]
MPKISVVTVNYNNAEGLRQTIQSVIEQEQDEVEYIVIDGNSGDGSAAVIREFESNVDHWISERDKGVYEAMNKGIDMATGDYVLFLNSGDIFYNDNVLNEVAPILSGDLDIYYGNLVFSHSGKDMIREYPKSFDFGYFLERSLPHPGSFIKRSLFDRIFKYSENYRIVSDWEFFICAILKEKVTHRHLDKVISTFELDGMSNDPKNKAFIEEEREQVIRKHFPERYSEYKKWRLEKSKEDSSVGKNSDYTFTKKIKRWLKRFK